MNDAMERLQKDTWIDVGDNDRIFRSSDNYHVHLYRRKSGWECRISETFSQTLTDLPPCQSNEAAKAQALQAVADLRAQRIQRGKAVGR
jgi:hypothetical protein